MRLYWARVAHWDLDYLFEVNGEEARAVISRVKKPDGSHGRPKPCSPVLYDTVTVRNMAREKGGFWRKQGRRKREDE